MNVTIVTHFLCCTIIVKSYERTAEKCIQIALQSFKLPTTLHKIGLCIKKNTLHKSFSSSIEALLRRKQGITIAYKNKFLIKRHQVIEQSLISKIISQSCFKRLLEKFASYIGSNEILSLLS